jgi:hypothetical protein
MLNGISLRVPVLMLASALAGGIVAVTGVALASIPDLGGMLHACVNNTTGVVRIVDTSKSGLPGNCLTSGPLAETPVSWSKTGPQGPPGPGTGQTAYAVADARASFTISPGNLAISALQASVATVNNGLLDITLTLSGGSEGVFCPASTALPGAANLGVALEIDNNPAIPVHSTAGNPLINGAQGPTSVEYVTDPLPNATHTVQVFTTDPGAFLVGPAQCNVSGILKMQAVSGATMTVSPTA